MATGGIDRIVRLINVPSRTFLITKANGFLKGHNSPVTYVGIQAKENRLISTSQVECIVKVQRIFFLLILNYFLILHFETRNKSYTIYLKIIFFLRTTSFEFGIFLSKRAFLRWIQKHTKFEVTSEKFFRSFNWNLLTLSKTLVWSQNFTAYKCNMV